MNLYLNFLALKQKIEDEFVLKHGLDTRHLWLLAEVGRAAYLNQPLMTSDLLKLSKYGSPATIHRGLRVLRDLGLVLNSHQRGNRRTKYLVLSQISRDYYSELSALFFKHSMPLPQSDKFFCRTIQR